MEAMAKEWSNTGYLFRAVEDGGLGVTRARFRVSGYLTDRGCLPAAEHHSDSWRLRRAVAAADGPDRGDAGAGYSA